MAVDAGDLLDTKLPDSFIRVSNLLEERTHSLASAGDELLVAAALEATKDLFDLGPCFVLICRSY